MAPPACESESQAVEKTFWGVLGAMSASGGRSGREKGSWKIVWKALGTVLGPFWRLLGQFRVAFPPMGGPGAAPGGHFWRYLGGIFEDILGAQAENLKMICFQVFLCWFGSVFLGYVLSSLATLLRGRRRRTYAKTLKIHWLLWVASHMRLFPAAPEAIKFQRARVAKNDCTTA